MYDKIKYIKKKKNARDAQRTGAEPRAVRLNIDTFADATPRRVYRNNAIGEKKKNLYSFIPVCLGALTPKHILCSPPPLSTAASVIIIINPFVPSARAFRGMRCVRSQYTAAARLPQYLPQTVVKKKKKRKTRPTRRILYTVCVCVYVNNRRGLSDYTRASDDARVSRNRMR